MSKRRKSNSRQRKGVHQFGGNSRCGTGYAHTHKGHVPGGVCSFENDLPEADVEIASAPPEVAYCVNARLVLLRKYRKKMEPWLGYDGHAAIREVAHGRMDEQESEEWDQYGLVTDNALTELCDEAVALGFGYHHDVPNPPPHLTLHCFHGECDRHSVEGVSIRSNVPYIPGSEGVPVGASGVEFIPRNASCAAHPRWEYQS